MKSFLFLLIFFAIFTDVNAANTKLKKYEKKKFLEKLGIFARAEILSKNMKFLKKADLYYRIKRLTDEKGMGNQFKVIFASSNKINFNYGFD